MALTETLELRRGSQAFLRNAMRAPMLDVERERHLATRWRDHRDERATLPGPGGAAIPVVGAGSASYAGSAEKRARFNVYEIEGRAITCLVRAHDEGQGVFREVARFSLS